MTEQQRLPFSLPPGAPRGAPVREALSIGRRTLTLKWVKHPKARHYLLRVEEDGTVRVTLPRRGSRAEALRFVREKIRWIERERYEALLQMAASRWVSDVRVLLSGVWTKVDLVSENGKHLARFGGRDLPLPSAGPRAVSSAIAACLKAEATALLPSRLMKLAGRHGYRVAGATVRDQRSRWGSCSPSGRISLNWRLVQMPREVCDYILLHELAHLRHPDHSRRFWREMDRICPWHDEARRWLDRHAGGSLSLSDG